MIRTSKCSSRSTMASTEKRGYQVSIELSEKLVNLLQLKIGTTDCLRNRENSQLEFKESFNIGSRAKYAKTAASFANNKGGYIVFGVTKEPHHIKGLNVDNFESCDPSKLTEFFNSNFIPEIEWEMGVVEYFGHALGYIYISEGQQKPIIAVANNGNEFQEAGIYYRYRGQSTSIKYAELRNILEKLISRERQAWLQHISTIAKSGPTNIGIVDTVNGKLFGGGKPFLIDESLLSRLKFIREGHFSESLGEPALRLLGDLQPIAGFITDRPIAKGIHSDDLVANFLSERSLSNAQASAYLKETIFQASPYLPVNFYYSQSGMSEIQAREMFASCQNHKTGTLKIVLSRLFGKSKATPLGATRNYALDEKNINAVISLLKPSSVKSQVTERSCVLALLKINPQMVLNSLKDITPARICEAITHLSESIILERKTLILKILKTIYSDNFPEFSSADKTVFRKTLAGCDDVLYRQ